MSSSEDNTPPPQLPNCHPKACSIQICLARNGNNGDNCSREILELYRCCERLYVALDGDSKEGVKGGEACPTLNVLKRNLKERGVEYGSDVKA